MSNKVKIKEELRGVSLNKLDCQANISPFIQDIVISSKKKSLSLNAIRLILLLTANLKEKQIKKYKKKQLELFDTHWFEKDVDILNSIQLHFRFSEFLPSGNRNFEAVRDGLEELLHYSQMIKFERKGKDGKTERFQLNSTFISSYIIQERKGVRIVINNYWYRALINLTSRYNKFLKSAIFGLTEKSLVFYFYLKSLPQIREKGKEEYEDILKELKIYKGLTGTILRKEMFLKIFKSDLKYKSQIEQQILSPIREELNEKMDISFNWKWKDDDRKMALVAYQTKHMLETNVPPAIIDDYRMIRSAINYRVKRYELDKFSITILIQLYVKYTYPVVLKATDKKPSLRNLKGKEYIYEFHKLVIEEANKGEWENNYKEDSMRARLTESFFEKED